MTMASIWWWAPGPVVRILVSPILISNFFISYFSYMGGITIIHSIFTFRLFIIDIHFLRHRRIDLNSKIAIDSHQILKK